jgi:hypothetical protein
VQVDERVAMIPDVYPSFQFLPLGANTQWARNAGMNSLTWRDARAYARAMRLRACVRAHTHPRAQSACSAAM